MLRFLGVVCALAVPLAGVAAGRKAPLRALIVTGGHDFEREPFLDIFRSIPNLTFREAAHPNAHALLKPQAAQEYDVLVLYDMWQPISEEAKADFVSLLRRGKPVVALHHALAGYNDWPEYTRIIGGRYRLNKETRNGVERPGSTYQHDVKFRVKIVDPRDPVTRGMGEFEIHDETYGDFDVLPGVKPLLTADHPTSGKVIAWRQAYGRSRVVYIQLGHGPEAYANPSYRRLVAQAVQWAAGGGSRTDPR